LFKETSWAKDKTDANPLFGAALPNRFVAIVPADQAQRLAEEITERVRGFMVGLGDRTLRKILKEIQQGKFARQWISENARGRRKYDRLMKKDLNHKIEKVGAALRARMPWLSEERA
jgi:ketol-acid reductoisomerase